MKPEFIPHAAYQQFLLDNFRRYYGPTFVIINKDWPLVTKFWMTDLSAMTTLLHDLYSDRGPEARDPASMFRSFLLFIMTNPEKGITKWVDEMNRTAFYAILSGFEVGDVPGVGTFYDFFKRLWASSEKHLRSQRRKRKSKPKKGKKKGEKAPTATPGRVARLVNWMMRHAAKKTDLPADRLFHFFQENIVSVSSRLGLLGDYSALSASGDGTPIVTAAYSRSKSTCDCRAQGLAECNHPRIYPSPTVTPACGCSTAKYGHTFSRKPRMIHDCFRKHHATPKDGSSFTSAALRSSVPTNERRWTTVSKPVGIAQP